MRSRRWRGSLFGLRETTDKIVLFGAGEFGIWVLDRLRRAGVEPCCFSDNNKARWGIHVDGLEVLSPQDAIARFAATAAFVVTIFNGSAARDQLRHLNCTHVLSAATLFWKYPEVFMPDLGIDCPELLAQQESQIRHCFELLSDESSRQELCNQVEWRYWLTPEFLPLPHNAGELYFPADLVLPDEQEIFVDCGAFDGDSIRGLLRRRQPFRHVYALEPDPANRDALQAFLAKLPPNVRERVTVWPYAVSNKNGIESFAANRIPPATEFASNAAPWTPCRGPLNPLTSRWISRGQSRMRSPAALPFFVRACPSWPSVYTIALSIYGRFPT
jgi:hypothetical protein